MFCVYTSFSKILFFSNNHTHINSFSLLNDHSYVAACLFFLLLTATQSHIASSSFWQVTTVANMY